MMLTLLSLGLSLRMLNCVPFCQSREQRYIVVICRILIITFTVSSYRLCEVRYQLLCSAEAEGCPSKIIRKSIPSQIK